MNWLYVGVPLLVLYIIWFTILLRRKKFSMPLLVIAMAHIPYLLINLVAPFRGLLDSQYAGYHFGWLDLPKGPTVTVVVGFIVVSSIFIASRALLDQMTKKVWQFTFLFDAFLSIMIALPIFLEIVLDPDGSRIELGEYLQISGWVVAVIVLILFAGPTFYALYYSGRKVFARSENSI
ncbi:MAG: hypothetical protein RLN86_12490 [Cyclobacteriaceae bacterium]